QVSGVTLANGDFVPADLVVLGIGIVPNIELAETAGLAVDDGIVVDALGRTSHEDIYAAGDCT
ncbi:MAG TPA: pyridine nucleotide-disulfide oxidoreductase, partial [Rhodobiaceae bacterium]|nr:pyridine nucleotide-disulfide oxidoreductase [Rhodobiaceae bacterium]